MTKARELGDNAQNTKPKVIDAKGDLIVGTGSDAADNLAAGASGETLVADSSTTTGLRYTENYAAGKNKIINGDFRINQRAFTSTTTNDVYGLDRWGSVIVNGGGTVTYSTQAFTPGAAPVAGYEGTNFARLVTASQVNTDAWGGIKQKIESVRTFAGQTVTVSFWAKAGTGTPNIVCYFEQDFGGDGSPSSKVNVATTKQAISTSWARYSFTFNIPSISGKTIGTTNDGFLMLIITVSAGSNYDAVNDSIGIQNGTFDIWGVQVEDGSVATAFQTATGTLAGELAACQRYYFRFTGGTNGVLIPYAFAATTTFANGQLQFPVPMRIAPTSLDIATLQFVNFAGSTFAMSSVSFNETTATATQVFGTVSGVTAGHAGKVAGSGASSFVGLSAEL